jgi:glyoxylase-like metal-dependent hydrolase (beta-lactamase superfamily II)
MKDPGNDRYGACIDLIGCLTLIVMGILLLMAQPVQAGSCDVLDKDSRPSNWDLPDSAVDTDQIPKVSIDPNAAADRPLPVYRLAGNTYMLFGNISTLNEQNRGFNANAGFIVTAQGVIVIDTLGTPRLGQRLINSIRCITDRPIRYLVVTHNHPDHAYGAAAFMGMEGITVIAHSGTVDYNHSATLESSVDYRNDMLAEDMQGFKPLQADIYMNTEDFASKRIRLGEEVIDIYNTGKHHSYGDLVVHQVNRNIVWISDLAFNQRTTYMGDGDSAQILKAQDWLLQTFPHAGMMVPGHGSAQTPPFPMVSKTRDYVTRMRKAMQQAVDDGTGMLDAVQSVEFEDWQDVPLYEMNQRANANFVYREMEQAYFDDD